MERETLEDDKISDNEMRLEDEGISDIPPEESQPHRPPKRKDTYKRSKVWDHFIAYTDGRESLELNTMDVKESCSHVKFDQEALRQGLARMIIMDELPFKFVENEGFRQFISLALPQFVIPSRTTITRDCYKLFFDEKRKLINYFKSSGQRISLTTDTWTSNQRLTYMCLTAHYIDSDWKMHKVILNFIPCPTHRGDDVGLLIEKCLLDWGIDKVFAITVDNASSNDTTIAYLRRRFINWGTAILDGKYLHMRCVAHIINLIVKDGLKELNDSIERVRTVVRYVRQSPARTRKFNDYVVEENIQSVFERYEIYDADFRNDFMPGGHMKWERKWEIWPNLLYMMFEEYKKMYSSTTSHHSTTLSSESSQELDDDIERTAVRDKRKKWKQMVSEIGCGHKSELDSYLNEEIETDESPSFSITEWWKLHTPRFPILARLARDVLAMPISTVASESAFSTGGRIIDDFRASLTPKMAQALICCQDWMRHTPFKSVEEDFDAIDNILKGIV
ncbi:UNVERIFIED_CONTAM: putative AC transposase [Sesamum calycinum]|uniref:AC transposase n=1 Tax=Sesamum calycinum TaxID=2727403 RepID=A0AAW2M9I3_9LAMI